MNLKALNAYLFLNSKREKPSVNVLLNILLLLLASQCPLSYVLFAVFIIFQASVNVEFTNDGKTNIYLFVMGQSLKELSYHRTVAKISIKALMLLPAIFCIAIWKTQMLFIIYYLLIMIASYFVGIFKIAIQYRYASKVRQTIGNLLLLILFLYLLSTSILDLKLTLLACFLVLIVMALVANKTLDNCDMEKIYLRGGKR